MEPVQLAAILAGAVALGVALGNVFNLDPNTS